MKAPKVSPITLDEWQAALDALTASRATPRPPGAKTSGELAIQWEVSRDVACKKIRAMLEKGIIERCGNMSYPTGSKAALYRVVKKK